MSHHHRVEMSSVPYEDLKININQQQSSVPPSPPGSISSVSSDESKLKVKPGEVTIDAYSQAHIYMMAGAAAGILEHCVMYPVDSVKTRMQSLHPHPRAVYKNVNHALRKMMYTEGMLRPVRGISIVAVGAGPAHALYFSSYEGMKKLLGNNGQGGHFPIANAVSGAVATVFHDGAMNPIEVIKQRLQMYGSPYRGAFDCAKTIFRTEGFSAFYRSFTTQVTMNIPFQCMHFVAYEFMREILNPSGGYDPKTHLIAGATAGGVAAACTTPLDVAKTLLNTQEKRAMYELAASKQLSSKRIMISGMFNALKTVHKLRGFHGYFRGLKARVIYQMPSCAISWSVYEFFKHNLSLQISEQEIVELTS